MVSNTCKFMVLLSVFLSHGASGAYSSIVEAQGQYCDSAESESERLQLALTAARRNAAEAVQTSIQTYSKVEKFAVVDDLIESYSNASVETLSVLSTASEGDCLTVSIRAEVTPEKNIDQQFVSEELLADPTLPLTVKLWLNKARYNIGEQVIIYIKANKPFFGRLVYTMNDGTRLQLLPNPYRKDHHFQGQVLYTVPDAKDDFLLEVTPPLGVEQLTLFASTFPLGELETSVVSGMYLLNGNQSEADIGSRTRGIKIKAANPQEIQKTNTVIKSEIAEFAEVSADVVITR